LNCALSRNDEAEKVLHNRFLMIEALSEVAQKTIMPTLVFVNQKHTNVAVLADPNLSEPPIADALVTNQPGILIGIQTADCVPVLFVDAENGVVGAAHAGWRGFASGVLDSTIDLMIAQGAKRESISAAIGPCIWADSFEVGQDVRDAMPAFADLFSPWPMDPNKIDPQKFAFDLPEAVRRALVSKGIQNVSASPMNTYTNEDLYFSYRRSCHQGATGFGCQASIIGIL
jgi:hypothetical protein